MSCHCGLKVCGLGQLGLPAPALSDRRNWGAKPGQEGRGLVSSSYCQKLPENLQLWIGFVRQFGFLWVPLGSFWFLWFGSFLTYLLSMHFFPRCGRCPGPILGSCWCHPAAFAVAWVPVRGSRAPPTSVKLRAASCSRMYWWPSWASSMALRPGRLVSLGWGWLRANFQLFCIFCTCLVKKGWG